MKSLRWPLVALCLFSLVGRGRAQATPAPVAVPADATATPGSVDAASDSSPSSTVPAAPPPESQSATTAEAVSPIALPAPPTPDPLLDAALSGGASIADLQALGLGEGSKGFDDALHFSGFMDFTAVLPIQAPGVIEVYQPKNSTFYMGNINLYLNKNISESWRTMAEVRFTYLPNGTVEQNGGGISYASTRVVDYNDNGRVSRYGGIIMQRAYVEWTMHRLATLRAGQFLTPYGIWNVDHGSPTYITVGRPYAVGSGWFPERQTGLELFGTWNASNYSTLGYHLTFSNGTGPISEYRDLDANKAIGGRAFWESRRHGYLRIGVSGYYGRDTNAVPAVSLAAGAPISFGQKVLSQYDNLSLAADIKFKLGGFLFQSEWVGQQRRFTKAGRPIRDRQLASVAKAFDADTLLFSGYGLVGYRFSWYDLMPFLMAQYSHDVLADGLAGLNAEPWIICPGINLHPTEGVTFKAEYDYSRFLGNNTLFHGAYHLVALQLAWAF